LTVGTLLPAHASALGKALLAHRDQVASTLDGHALASFTPATVTDPDRLREELEETVRRGWAIDVGELVNGVASIAAPIEDRRRVTVGAIGIAGPIERLCGNGEPRAELVGHVIEAARGVSGELGAISL
jgi:DNA-binding IclR family transcriptional regulator